jgi:hypothetical protein
MKELEKYIKFSEKIGHKQDSMPLSGNSSWALKIAAVILVFLTAGVFLFDHSIHEIGNLISKQTSQVVIPTDVSEAMEYYSTQATHGMREIHQVAGSKEQAKELGEMAMNDMKALDANISELEQAYRQNPHDERISDALIRNQQMKKTIVDNMLQKINKEEK